MADEIPSLPRLRDAYKPGTSLGPGSLVGNRAKKIGERKEPCG